jgi:hypothetical protein
MSRLILGRGWRSRIRTKAGVKGNMATPAVALAHSRTACGEKPSRRGQQSRIRLNPTAKAASRIIPSRMVKERQADWRIEILPFRLGGSALPDRSSENAIDALDKVFSCEGNLTLRKVDRQLGRTEEVQSEQTIREGHSTSAMFSGGLPRNRKA